MSSDFASCAVFSIRHSTSTSLSAGYSSRVMASSTVATCSLQIFELLRRNGKKTGLFLLPTRLFNRVRFGISWKPLTRQKQTGFRAAPWEMSGRTGRFPLPTRLFNRARFGISWKRPTRQRQTGFRVAQWEMAGRTGRSPIPRAGTAEDSLSKLVAPGDPSLCGPGTRSVGGSRESNLMCVGRRTCF